MSKYQVRLGENVTDKIVNCGAGVYWYIHKLQSEIERLNKELNTYKYRPKTRFRDVIELRDKINKAIELIKKYQNTCILDEEWSSIDKPLLEILKGEDNE